MASSALAQSLLLPALVVSSHHGQQQQQVQGRSNHKKPIAPQASLGPLATRGGSSSGQIRSSSYCRCSRKKTTVVAAAVAFHSFSGMRRAVAIDSLASSVGGRGKDFSSVVAAALDVKRRQYGGPWTTPAAKRGVVTAMFERFTEKAIKVIMLAQEEARRLGHNFVGTEQILLGLIGEGTGIAAKVLKSMGVNLKEARVEVEKIIGRGSGFVAVEIPFTPRAKRVLELSLEEARQLGHNYIGTEHLLLGLLREGEGVAARVLENLGADPSNIRTQVIRMVGESTEAVGAGVGGGSSSNKMPTLEEYGTNLTKLAEDVS
jgi:ATP-dependent Clp protease ATP-binding subunit ClpC